VRHQREVLATIKEAFQALANYPKHEPVTGLRAGNVMISPVLP
jgi:hypothetical protein